MPQNIWIQCIALLLQIEKQTFVLNLNFIDTQLHIYIIAIWFESSIKVGQYIFFSWKKLLVYFKLKIVSLKKSLLRYLSKVNIYNNVSSVSTPNITPTPPEALYECVWALAQSSSQTTIVGIHMYLDGNDPCP